MPDVKSYTLGWNDGIDRAIELIKDEDLSRNDIIEKLTEEFRTKI